MGHAGWQSSEIDRSVGRKSFVAWMGHLGTMESTEPTCWTLIRAAAEGDPLSRDDFARLYLPVAETYFSNRWRGAAGSVSMDDAIQDVFVECFKAGGVLKRVADQPPEGFRRFFHGVLRNIALRHESKRGLSLEPAPEEPISDETSSSRVFDRAWAQLILKQAARIQTQAAAALGERALKRVALLRQRFNENLPIREIAEVWQVEAAWLHHEYAIAREEFSAALRQALAFQNPAATPNQIEQTYNEFLELLR